MGPGCGSGGTARGGGGRGHDSRFGRDHGDDSGSRRPKINFPSFDGESDPLPWLNKCVILPWYGYTMLGTELTLIEREDDTRSWDNFLVYFSHNVIPT
jgi:hypothetical protein